VRACAVQKTANQAGQIGIVGIGSRMASYDQENALAERFCAGLSSCFARGYGYSCTGERMAVHIYIADWRDVDLAIDRIGSTLRDDQLGEEVLIGVEPVAHFVRQSATIKLVAGTYRDAAND
jgi:hypothetical protein